MPRRRDTPAQIAPKILRYTDDALRATHTLLLNLTEQRRAAEALLADPTDPDAFDRALGQTRATNRVMKTSFGLLAKQHRRLRRLLGLRRGETAAERREQG